MLGSKVSRGEGMIRGRGCLARRRVSDNRVRATAANAVHVEAFIMVFELVFPRQESPYISLVAGRHCL